MPPILGLIISRCDNDETVVFLSTAHDLSQFKLWDRKTVKEGCLFISRTVSTRVAVGSRQIIEHEGQGAFVARWNDGICVTMVADLTYPQRVAFLCLEEVHTTFKRTVGVTVWARVEEDDVCDFKSELRAILKNYQDPREVDALKNTQAKVDEAQAVIHRDIMTLLENNESLDALVEKSDDLSCEIKCSGRYESSLFSQLHLRRYSSPLASSKRSTNVVQYNDYLIVTFFEFIDLFHLPIKPNAVE
eukprot:GHVN01091646.1.p1 GENE.GHVN01091646.1~~GHVN01091646.1.p1  ORF type:complete len:246 (+),score=18.30 GHVN01091646.1:683-1420(+)